MKRVIVFFVLILFCCNIFAMPFSSDVYVEQSPKGISIFADRKWRFTESTFTVRNPKKKTQTVYPITYDSDYIYLGTPTEVDPKIGVYSVNKIVYVLGEHSLLLCFEDDYYLKLVEQEYKNKVVNIATTAAFGLVATSGIAKGLYKSMVAEKKAAATALAATTISQTHSLGLESNRIYTSSDGLNTFVTDDLGRPISATGTVQLGDSQRNKNLTRKVGNLAGSSSDDGGHLIADSLGGPTEAYNLVPMSSSLNRGQYEKLERELKSYAENGHTVKLDIQPQYSDNGIKPSSIIYKYWVDGIEFVKTFLNE